MGVMRLTGNVAASEWQVLLDDGCVFFVEFGVTQPAVPLLFNGRDVEQPIA